jgi:hypothetical protein
MLGHERPLLIQRNRGGFALREELDPRAMEQRFLSHLPGGPGKVLGVVRMAHAARSVI